MLDTAAVEVYSGRSIRVVELGGGLLELVFDRRDEGINKFDARTVDELRAAAVTISRKSAIHGVLISSAKDAFIVGADIGEFGALFSKTQAEIEAHTRKQNTAFTSLADLPVPTVAAVNGYALGGGLELALCADYRVLSSTAQVGLPEVRLGIFPGFGGTVRLPRVVGIGTAVEWITGGAQYSAEAAQTAGLADDVATPERLREIALAMLRAAVSEQLPWRTNRQARLRAPAAGEVERQAFSTAREKLAHGPKHQPAAMAVLRLLEETQFLGRDAALAVEAREFSVIASSQAAASLVQVFLNDQAVKKTVRQLTRDLPPIRQAAVLGAGIMGGGIASTSALRGVPVRMKDIAPSQLDVGMSEARKLVDKQVSSGRLDANKAEAILASIVPQLDDAGFEAVDIVIEAIVENLALKRKVLAEVEKGLGQEVVIASNTSSLRIDDMADALQRPHNFVGMHFFNPVPVMPLVEIIRGRTTGDRAVAVAVAQAVAMGKVPIVVRDCPGFLVNRIITPYTQAFFQLIADGADFRAIDKAAESFGWPMGPAYLQDVVGLDTASHVGEAIAEGYGERMRSEANASRLLAAHGRYGQKNGIGFYRYEADAKGRLRKFPADDSPTLLAAMQLHGAREFTDEEINQRMMLALVIESARALEEGVVATPAELDTALLLGIGFPAYLGGALKYADWLGMRRVIALSDNYADLGPIYRATERMRAMARTGERYYA